jgi:hypothetical protein
MSSRSWIPYAALLVVFWGVWGAFSSLPADEYGYPDEMIYILWSLTMLIPAYFIRRTLVYGILTASLALVYFGSVAIAQAVFHALTDQEDLPQLTIVVSTLVIAALFNPLRRRIKSFIDRRFYRSKYDARRTLEAFSATLSRETDLDALSDDLVTVVKGTMQPTHVSLWLRSGTNAKGEHR